MRKIRSKGLPEYCVQLTEPTYRHLMALAIESGRAPGELLSIAVTIFAHAVKDVTMMHPPRKRPKPRPAAAPIGADPAKTKQRSPVSPIGPVVTKMIRNVREKLPCENRPRKPAQSRRS